MLFKINMGNEKISADLFEFVKMSQYKFLVKSFSSVNACLKGYLEKTHSRIVAISKD